MDSYTSVLQNLYRFANSGTLENLFLTSLEKADPKIKECEVLDFKEILPKTDIEYSKLYKDILALHNTYGGFIIFGVKELEKDRSFKLVGVENEKLDFSKIRDNLKVYTGHDVRVIVNTHELSSGVKIETIWIEKREAGENPLKFIKNGPEEKPGKTVFKRDETVFRRLDCNAIASNSEDYGFLYSPRIPPSLDNPKKDQLFTDPLENSLPDRSLVCANFVGRNIDMSQLWTWLSDDFSRVKLIAGEGGLGKTSLAYHFAEQISISHVKPFVKVVWLSAKEKQFIPQKDDYQETLQVNYSDANSLFKAIASELGCTENDFHDLDTRDLLKLALRSCEIVPSFIVIDDVDSLTTDEQKRVLEFGLMAGSRTKFLLTTRVNFTYSTDNVLKLNGFEIEEYKSYVEIVRKKYRLAPVTDQKLNVLHEVTGGSPLFTDSLFRLELRGNNIDQAIANWRNENGQEVRKAALLREVQQLSRQAKRVLFVISHQKNCSSTELIQYLDYSEQTLGDCLQELSNLFLINAPIIGKDTRYSVETNTGRLVTEIANGLNIDHSALLAKIKSHKTDAINLGITKRSNIVGLAISEAMAKLKNNDSIGALESVSAAAKRQKRPHPDLLLAIGRCNLKLNVPNFDEANKAFSEAYSLGLRKSLLFQLWFETEFARSAYDSALEIANKAIANNEDSAYWYERIAEVHVSLAKRSKSNISNDAAIRELNLAIDKFTEARKRNSSFFEKKRLNGLVEQALDLKAKLSSKNFNSSF